MARIIHFEIPVENIERAMKFYSQTLGWKAEKWENMDYWLITTGTEGPGIDGAFLLRDDGPMCNNLVAQVESIEDTVATWAKCGGEVIQEKYQVPTIGYFATLKDTEGNILTVMVPDSE